MWSDFLGSVAGAGNDFRLKLGRWRTRLR